MLVVVEGTTLMTGPLKVVFSSLSDLADGLANSADRVAEQLTELDSAVARLAESWQGEAHDLFSQRLAEWRATAADLHRSLHDFRRLIVTAHGNYAEAEGANLRIWGQG
jgi:6 kDa early secretory antigenic target